MNQNKVFKNKKCRKEKCAEDAGKHMFYDTTLCIKHAAQLEDQIKLDSYLELFFNKNRSNKKS